MTAKSEFKVSMEDRKQTYVIIPAYNEETRVRPVTSAIELPSLRSEIIPENSLIVNETATYIIMDKLIEGTKSFSCLKIDTPNNLST